MSFKRGNRPVQARDGSWFVSDLYAAAFLHALGHKVMRVQSTGQGGRIAFVFGVSNTLEVDYDSFVDGESIGIRRFVDSVYELKAILRESTLHPRPEDGGSCCIQ